MKNGGNSNNRITLRVAETNPKFVGKGLALVDPRVMEEMGLSAGDVTEIGGSKKKSYVLLWSSQSDDYGKGLIRIDGYTRNNIGVGIDDSVTIRKVAVKKAEQVVLAPTEELSIVGLEDYLPELLEGRVVAKGDVVPLNIMGRRIGFAVKNPFPSDTPSLIDSNTEFVIGSVPKTAAKGVPRVSYEDIGGLKNEVQKVREMIELPLRHPEIFDRIGIEAPKGVLLHGPPGTGKTLLAKAVANETNANFYSISGPEIMSKFYGESEERLREVFKEAEENAPSIIFIDEIDSIAKVTHGFVGADLEALSKEAAMRSLRRILPEINLEQPKIPAEILNKIKITKQDFDEALRDIQPSALREVLVQRPNMGWDDIGGLQQVKEELAEAIEWPLKHANLFAEANVEPPKGILLYGPPGTGKTMIAKAVAATSEANFISIKGPELISKWVGESEKGIREVFRKARQAAPCVIFFDELDAIAPRRGGSEGDSHVTERVISQMLTELDGLEDLKGVVVIGATNRPDIIDEALLRPGRFDRMLEVPVPDKEARKHIFQIHTKKKPLESDVNIDKLIEMTEGMTGADIAALVNAAAMTAIKEHVRQKGGSKLRISMRHFETALNKIKKKLGNRIVDSPNLHGDDAIAASSPR